ncbi:hypothetical protein [Agromyces albus]|uniref:hypothetical protein n=1 Tax=Agromyces albus TaxID=205332 RepID=UPI002787CA7B|nr:hypothetical protein [Agromyces albus]MDQ0577154.1 hypothetical protein [Agromyces albus]
MNEGQDSSEVGAQIDTSRAPLGVRAALALVQAVAASDDRVERHYLEVKGDLDLTKKNDIAKIAKFILGAANRLPAVASAAFEGYGVMIIGVVPGEIRGVPPIEVLDIDKIVSQYLGVAGPHWDLVRVPVKGSNNEVLVILVDPPRDGQDPFPCRKEGDNLFNGRIYVRADGETREAKAEELDLLLRRGKYQPAAEVAFEVEILGLARPVQIDHEKTIEAYIARTKSCLLDALPKPEPEPEVKPVHLSRGFDAPGAVLRASAAEMMQEMGKRAGFPSLGMSVLGSDPEKRTETQYHASIERWEGRVREKWGDAPDILAGYALKGVAVRVSNATKIFFHKVEARVHLDGDVRGILWRDGSLPLKDLDLDLPTPPRAWGPVPRSPFNPYMSGQPQYASPSIALPYRSPLDWNNSGSVDLTLDVGDLRPRQTFTPDDDELILVLPPTAQGEVHGTWEITARDHNEIYTGEIGVKIGAPLDLTGAVREFFELD